MGVPAFFRWLSKKYPSLIVHCVEEKPKVIDGVKVPVDTSRPNPNDTEFDNLYLDMNGIIHPCCHPEDRPAPKNEDEMMVLIFEFIDRIFSIVRPRKVLYMAIDGVAPRAKMNQQRSRRFRAAKESIEKREAIARIKAELREKGAYVPPDKPADEHFDSNCITPGTPFMFRLAECLRYYIHDRLNSDPGWRNVKVILSDANVPGEGEHKIMDYIRRQRAQPDHDPNTHHCLCGADADLIMLGLATHEPHFTIIREEFKPNQPKSCDICGQVGHEMTECAGAPKPKEGEFDELSKNMGSEQEFIFVRLTVLREYLESELTMVNLPFKQDIERAIDDWVFMCFFVGNDFLPHLPSLEIREGAIDRLQKLYKDIVYKTGGYLTDSGVVRLDRVQLVLSELGKVEDEIFKQRRETELDFRRRDKEKKKRMKSYGKADKPSWMTSGQYAPQTPGRHGGGAGAISNPRQTAYEMRVEAMKRGESSSHDNHSAAAALRSMLVPSGSEESQGTKRKADELEEEDDEPNDEVKLWEDGWKDRYYQSKFAVGSDDIEFRHTVGNEYVIGLCWVLRYYYQGCASWKWYFPYHYAPFASDFVNIADLPNDFERNTEPFKPLEQLMGVFPAASKKFLPVTWQDLMCNPESPIIDFYPTNFKIDLNGKKYAWQGVALLPFVEEKRLKSTLSTVYPDLLPEETARNVRGSDRLFVSGKHPVHDFLESLYEGSGAQETVVELDSAFTQGMRGSVGCDEFVILSREVVYSPLDACPDIDNNTAICVTYKDPQYDPGYLFKSVILPGAKFPPKSLTADQLERAKRTRGAGRGSGRGQRGYSRGGGVNRPQLGFTPDAGYRNSGQKDPSSFVRHVRHNMGLSSSSSQEGGGRQFQAMNYDYGGGSQRGGGGSQRGGGGNYGNRSHGGGGYDNRWHNNQGGGMSQPGPSNSRNYYQTESWGNQQSGDRHSNRGGYGRGRGGSNQWGNQSHRQHPYNQGSHQQNYRGGPNRQNYQSRQQRYN